MHLSSRLRAARRPVHVAAVAVLGVLPLAAAADESLRPAPEELTPVSAPTSSAASPASPESDGPLEANEAAPEVSPAAAGAQANPLEERVKELEETVKKLLGTIETLQKQQAKPADPAQVEKIVDDKLKQQKPLVGWQNGFFVESQDGNSRLRLRGLVNADQRAFIGGGRTGTDSFFIRRARPILEGTVFKYVDFRIMPDFGGGSTSLQDAYLIFKYFPQANLQVGKFKEPVSLERLQSSADIPFIERSIAQNLAPNRDVGVQLYGGLFKNTLTYYAGAFNGVNDNGSSEGDVDSDKDFAGRLFYEPFKNRPQHALQGLGFGVGASIGERNEPLSATLRTAGRSAFFRYRQPTTGPVTPGAVGMGTHTRVAPGFYFFKGGLGLMGEYIRSTQEVGRGGVRDTVSNDGLFVQATYVLTGEKASFRGVVPRKEFDPSKRQWGAFEIAARYSRIDFDSAAFRRGFANPASSVGDADEFTFGLNWYLNRAVKIQLNYVRTNFDRALTFGNSTTDHEDVFLSRFQVAF